MSLSRKSISLLVLILAFWLFPVISAQADTVTEEWIVRYDGPGHLDDVAEDMVLDSAGNIYVTGRSEGGGTNYDYATIKYDPNGNLLWVSRYNGDANGSDIAYAMTIDADGNIYVTGESTGSDASRSYDYATIKYDPNGNEVWVERYNSISDYDEAAHAIAVDSAGHVYVTGETNYDDFLTVKYEPNGNELWAEVYPNGDDGAQDIAIDVAGNVYATGASFSSDTNEDYATAKYDSSGSELWVARYNGPADGYDVARAIAVDTDENLYVTGISTATDTNMDCATVKVNRFGSRVWASRY
ncbi:MAG: SBBP repeat-containing protein, partial [Planctomycetota bacterium]